MVMMSIIMFLFVTLEKGGISFSGHAIYREVEMSLEGKDREQEMPMGEEMLLQTQIRLPSNTFISLEAFHYDELENFFLRLLRTNLLTSFLIVPSSHA